MSRGTKSCFVDDLAGCSDEEEEDVLSQTSADMDFIVDDDLFTSVVPCPNLDAEEIDFECLFDAIADSEKEDNAALGKRRVVETNQLAPSNQRRRIEDESEDEDDFPELGREVSEDYSVSTLSSVEPAQRTRDDLQDEFAEAEETVDPRKRSRRFAMTLNNPTDNEINAFQRNFDTFAKFRLYGKENFGIADKTPHLQCYIELNSLHSITGLQKKISTAQGFRSRYAIRPCKYGAEANIRYCSKDGDVFQTGDYPRINQGKRTDLDKVAAALKSGTDLLTIAKENMGTFVRYHAGISKLHQMLCSQPRSSMTLGYWISGPTGVGKSRWAHSLTPESTYVKDGATKWWDGYNGQETIVIDDYRANANLGFSTLLRLADRYPMPIEMKGSFGQLNSKRIIVTSPLSIDEMFSNLEWMSEGSLNQLKRRFKEIRFGEGGFDHTLKLVDVVHQNAGDVNVD